MKLHYKIIGSGSPIIILHGLFGMLDNWRTIARMLEDKYQCILVDLRNHGKSPHDDEMNYEVMADDILELLIDLNLTSVDLIGHSMGGKVAMQFALTYPDRVKNLLIIDISPKKYPPHHQVVIKAIESIDPPSLKDRLEAENSFRRHLGNDESTIQFLLKNLTRLPEQGFEWKACMSILIANYEVLMDSINVHATYDKPTLFIRGDLSKSVIDEDWNQIHNIFPAARLITIPNAGHWVHADQPKALAEVIMELISA